MKLSSLITLSFIWIFGIPLALASDSDSTDIDAELAEIERQEVELAAEEAALAAAEAENAEWAELEREEAAIAAEEAALAAEEAKEREQAKANVGASGPEKGVQLPDVSFKLIEAYYPITKATGHNKRLAKQFFAEKYGLDALKWCEKHSGHVIRLYETKLAEEEEREARSNAKGISSKTLKVGRQPFQVRPPKKEKRGVEKPKITPMMRAQYVALKSGPEAKQAFAQKYGQAVLEWCERHLEAERKDTERLRKKYAESRPKLKEDQQPVVLEEQKVERVQDTKTVLPTDGDVQGKINVEPFKRVDQSEGDSIDPDIKEPVKLEEQMSDQPLEKSSVVPKDGDVQGEFKIAPSANLHEKELPAVEPIVLEEQIFEKATDVPQIPLTFKEETLTGPKTRAAEGVEKSVRKSEKAPEKAAVSEMDEFLEEVWASLERQKKMSENIDRIYEEHMKKYGEYYAKMQTK